MTISASLKRAVANAAPFVPLLGEGWIVAGLVFALVVGVVVFVFFGVVFFPGQPHADPGKVNAVLKIAALSALAAGLAGLRVHVWYRAAKRATADDERRRLFHLAVAGHRLAVAGLFLIFGLSALWIAWFVSPLAGVLAVTAFILALAVGVINAPNFLGLLVGRSARFTRTAGRLDRILRVALGFVVLLGVLRPLANLNTNAVFLVLTQILSALSLSWLPTMVAAARINLEAIRTPFPEGDTA